MRDKEAMRYVDKNTAYESEPLKIRFITKGVRSFRSLTIVDASTIPDAPVWALWAYVTLPEFSVTGKMVVHKYYKTYLELRDDAPIFYEAYEDNVSDGSFVKGPFSYKAFGPAMVKDEPVGIFIENTYKSELYHENETAPEMRYNLRLTPKNGVERLHPEEYQEFLKKANEDGFVRCYNEKYHYTYFELKNVPHKMLRWWLNYTANVFPSDINDQKLISVHYCHSEWCRSHDYRDKFMNKQIPIKGKYRCTYCGKLFDKKDIEVDHIIPVSALMYSGPAGPRSFAYDLGIHSANDDNNLTLSCRKCNQKKGDDYSSKWIDKTPIGRKAKNASRYIEKEHKKRVAKKALLIAFIIFVIIGFMPFDWYMWIFE